MAEYKQEPRLRDNHKSYHFFGDLWLELPEEHLQPKELQRLRELEPLIKNLEQRKEHGFSIDLEEEFRSFTNREAAAWRNLGVERPPEFLLPPAGSNNSPIACHLYNPTFFTDRPYSQSMMENKNPTMVQLQQVGFSLQNTFFFDHVCRRDRTEDVLLFYSSEIIGIHEEFMMLCRKSMSAKVEICWGVPVRNRMKKLLSLESVALWGEYRDVEIFLETNDGEIVRFLIFVSHPQYFFYHSHHTDSGSKFRLSKGRRQDLYLEVASRLGGVTVTPNFYELHHRPATYGHLRSEERQLVRVLESEAEEELKNAFPARFDEVEKCALLLAEKKRAEVANQSDVLIMSKKISTDHVGEARRRISIIERATESWLKVVKESFGNNYSITLLTCGSSDWDDVTQWDEIPAPLIRWIQEQDGLKIDREPISCSDQLVKAYHNLWNRRDPANLTLLQILFHVAESYLSMIRKRKRASVQSIYIPGEDPYDVMPRRCSNCGQRVLDDAFACYARSDPKIYFNVYRKEGCGLPDCKKFTQLIPVDARQGSRRMTHARIQKPRSADWEEYLLRCSAEELVNLPRMVKTMCASCKRETAQDEKPRWTSEGQPRFIIRVHKCETCNERFCSWPPVDKSIGTISQVALVKKWKNLKAGGIEPADYPRRPDIYWSKKNQSTKLKELQEASQLRFGMVDILDSAGSMTKKRKVEVKARLKSAM